jgi:hypothetical protein
MAARLVNYFVESLRCKRPLNTDFKGQAFELPLRRLRIDTIDRIEFADKTLVERSAYPRTSISALSGRDA